MSEKSNALLQVRIEELRLQIQKINNPHQISIKTGCEFVELASGKYFKIYFFDKLLNISYPELVATEDQQSYELPVSTQALMCYYLLTADGSPFENRWISFAELPNGKFYQKAFQGYSGDEISNYFGNDVNKFININYGLNGNPLTFGDAGFSYMAFPRVPLAVVYHLGDEDFPATCKILFDASAYHYLPTDAFAILGSMLAHRILNKAKKDVIEKIK